MRLLINIPKEFEQHFQADRFEDSLHRLSTDAHLLAGQYEQETAVMLINAFKSAVTVPPHGRFSDLYELYNHLNEWYLTHKHGFSETEKIYIRAMLSGVKDAPTIIPAEEESINVE